MNKLLLRPLLVLGVFLSTSTAFLTPKRRTIANGALTRTPKVLRIDSLQSLSPSKRVGWAARLRTLGKRNDNDEEKNKFSVESIRVKTLEVLIAIVSKLQSLVPQKIWTFFEEISGKISFPDSWKVGLTSFLAGCVFSVAAILVPVYSSVETMTEPVTLFETILTDLDRGYVEQVDTKKLFETGVSAMLKSLDPYTEFEGKEEAVEMNESVAGRYGGVGLVISGVTPKQLEQIREIDASMEETANTPTTEMATPKIGKNDNDMTSNTRDKKIISEDSDQEDAEAAQLKKDQLKAMAKARERGIRVVSAFEGYAFDYGMRVGDKLVSVDGMPIGQDTTVEDVRGKLRGEPGSEVMVGFEREGVDGITTISIPRTVVKLRDVKLATLLGKPEDGIGYIQLTGFAAEAGREVRNSILTLQAMAEEASNGERSLQGLVLDLRGNPGGLLTSAVDVASLLVPKNSDIVSAKGRGFPGVLYRSRADPLLSPRTKLAVLVNGNTASAAEIVSGAVQDLDVGIIVGSDRTYGKGLVQNVEELPFNTALKFTVAKYYTPSGRCIQSTNYEEGGGLKTDGDGRYTAKKVADKDKTVFYTKAGRMVKDGGGIEADFKVSAPKASALEVTLLRSGVLEEFAAQWSKKHELSNNFHVDEETYREFQAFVNQKQKDGDIKLEALYNGPIEQLKQTLKQSGYTGSGRELDELKTTIVREVQKDFDKYRTDIKEDIGQSILARYYPESMLIERSVQNDKQVDAAIKLISDDKHFDKLLARTSSTTDKPTVASSSNALATASTVEVTDGARFKIEW